MSAQHRIYRSFSGGSLTFLGNFRLERVSTATTVAILFVESLWEIQIIKRLGGCLQGEYNLLVAP
jgi:hypothetical protein